MRSRKLERHESRLRRLRLKLNPSCVGIPTTPMEQHTPSLHTVSCATRACVLLSLVVSAGLYICRVVCGRVCVGL